MNESKLGVTAHSAENVAEPDLRQQTVTGVMWSAGARIGQQLLRFGVTVILARLLVPEDFGLVAMIAVFTGFASLFVDFGLSAALVQQPRLTEAHRSTAFWMNVAAGVVLSGVLAALAPGLAALYGEPRLVDLTLVLSLNFLLGSLTIVQSALLQRTMNFRRLAAIQVASSCAGGAVAIAAAAAGYGVWSLVALSLASTLATTVLLWLLTDWRPRRILDRQAMRELWKFSSNLAGFSAVNYWARNADNLIIGKFAGAGALGIYSRAYALMLMPLDQISGVVARVMFPALARIQEDRPRVKRAYLRAVGIIGLLSFPVLAGLFVVAEPFVLALYGSKWEAVVPVLQILCVAGFAQPVAATVGWIYQSQGRTDWQFRFGLVTSSATVASFAIGIHWGVHGVAAAYAIRTYALLYFTFLIPGRLIGMRFGEVFAAVRGALFATLATAAAVWAAAAALPDHWPSGALLAVQAGVGIGVYAALVHTLRLGPYTDLKGLVRERIRRRETVVSPA